MSRTPVWLLPHRLSLDAPVVALVWQDFVARCYPSPLRIPGRCVLGLTVWAIYLADRLLDAKRGDDAESFYRKHWGAMASLLALVLGCDLVTAVLWLRPVVFRNGLALAFAVGAYLCLFSYVRLGMLTWKRVAAAALFSSGVFLVASTSWTADRLLLPWTGFALLCLCNLRTIIHLEWRKHIDAVFCIWAGALCVLCVVEGGPPRWNLALATGAAGLIALTHWGRSLPKNTGRVLADAVLLAPILYR